MSIETLFTNFWNRMVRAVDKPLTGGLDVGCLVVDGKVSDQHYYLPTKKRTEHLYVRGKTGSGKTRLLLRMCLADLLSGYGFVFFDNQGDSIPLLLSAMAALAVRLNVDLSEKLVLIRPSDPARSIGLNILRQGRNVFVQIAAITETLMHRLGLTHLGVTVQELLRNALFVLAVNELTIIEIGPLLHSAAFRAHCLKAVTNQEVREFWQQRFEPLSEGMKNLRREPVLNKIGELVADFHFRDILGQQESTIDFDDILETGKWVLLDLSKGQLGPHSSTLGSLIVQQLVPAIFRRRSKQVFSLYLDEFPDLVGPGIDLEVLLSQSRKFSVSEVLAHQYSQQLSAQLSAAVEATGTHIYFQQSAADAQVAAQALDSGKATTELLKNLSPRRCLIKSGHYPSREIEVPAVVLPSADYRELVSRSLARYARSRVDIERDIMARRNVAQSGKESLHDWE